MNKNLKALLAKATVSSTKDTPATVSIIENDPGVLAAAEELYKLNKSRKIAEKSEALVKATLLERALDHLARAISLNPDLRTARVEIPTGGQVDITVKAQSATVKDMATLEEHFELEEGSDFTREQNITLKKIDELQLKRLVNAIGSDMFLEMFEVQEKITLSPEWAIGRLHLESEDRAVLEKAAGFSAPAITVR